MHRDRTLRALALCVLLLGGCGGGPAPPPPAQSWEDPGFVTQGDWTLYYAAFRSTDIAPELAREYGLAPGRSGSVVVVSVVGSKGPVDPAMPVTIEARSLDDVARPVTVRHVHRGEADSWLGEFSSTRREILVFKVSARPLRTDAPITASFRRELFLE